MSHFTVEGNFIDIPNRKIFSAKVYVEHGIIKEISDTGQNYDNYILPGFIDAHIHIESSMLIPSEFAKMAAKHGTVACVSDPHEIANVCGMDGIRFMIENGKTVPFYFYYGAPSCVPATSFESSGAIIGLEEIKELLLWEDIYYLSEMMNYPGVIHKDSYVIEKIQAAHHSLKPVDGHAPGLGGNDLDVYISAGISTDHESFTFDEGLEKLQKGMKLLIREGSAAKNFEALIPLIKEFPNSIMFCSDDKHPDDLMEGHINQLVARAIHQGYDLFDVLNAACITPHHHYKLKHGLLRKGDSADLIVIEDIKHFKTIDTYIQGKRVVENGISKILSSEIEPINHFNIGYCHQEDFNLKAISNKVNCINVIDGQLITNQTIEEICVENGLAKANIENDVLKIIVLNRYYSEKPAIAFVKNIGLKSGAFASTVAHDSHNIIAVGVDEHSISRAINLLVECKGGISYATESEHGVLPLPVAGLMSDEAGEWVGEKYQALSDEVKSLGTELKSPFMTLSFLALLVIPKLKLSDKGLFDGSKFQFEELFVS